MMHFSANKLCSKLCEKFIFTLWLYRSHFIAFSIRMNLFGWTSGVNWIYWIIIFAFDWMYDCDGNQWNRWICVCFVTIGMVTELNTLLNFEYLWLVILYLLKNSFELGIFWQCCFHVNIFSAQKMNLISTSPCLYGDGKSIGFANILRWFYFGNMKHFGVCM